METKDQQYKLALSFDYPGMRVLKTILDDKNADREWSINSIVKESNISRLTVYPILNTLTKRNVLIKENEGFKGRYKLVRDTSTWNLGDVAILEPVKIEEENAVATDTCERTSDSENQCCEPGSN